MPDISRRALLTGAASALMLGTLTACSTQDGVANKKYTDSDKGGSGPGYVEGDGTYTEIPADKRGRAVTWSAETSDGKTVSNKAYAGEVLVLNFWYAGCPPCRKEAPGLEQAYEALKAKGVSFLGVNIYDQKATADSFSETFKITYPTVLDVDDAKVRLAFSSSVPPKSVPTTLVIDRQGRVAKRILGAADRSVLETLVNDVLGEKS